MTLARAAAIAFSTFTECLTKAKPHCSMLVTDMLGTAITKIACVTHTNSHIGIHDAMVTAERFFTLGSLEAWVADTLGCRDC